jgi:hypothetical protein
MTTDRTALAAALHDMLGCRITCRGGRLANDRHASHSEAYLDSAERLLAALDGWTLLSNDDRDAAFDEIVRLSAENGRLRIALMGVATAAGEDTSGLDNPDQLTYPPIEKYALTAVGEMRAKFEEGAREDAATITALRAALKAKENQ